MGSELRAFAKKGYEAYGNQTDFKNFRGEPMPAWDELPETIQSAWVAAANVIAMETVTDFAKGLHEELIKAGAKHKN